MCLRFRKRGRLGKKSCEGFRDKYVCVGLTLITMGLEAVAGIYEGFGEERGSRVSLEYGLMF